MYYFNPKTETPYWIATTAERTDTTSLQVAGTKVFDTTLSAMYVYNGNAWIAIGDPGIVAGTQLSGLTSGSITTLHEHMVKIKKTANQSVTNSSTLANDLLLVSALAINQVVSFRLFLMYQATVAGDFKCAFASPAGSTISYQVIGPDENDNLSQQVGVASADTLILGGAGASVTRVVEITGSCVNADTAGNLQFQFAQNVAAGGTAATVLIGSYLHIVTM